jgi:5-methylcytosine-specific restriction endonuclease McrA
MMARKSSITNAFVNAIIPTIPPTVDEIEEALKILQLDPADLRCAYCGTEATEWDHLRPLVARLRPTGFISEIANLVPACGKCNQSKGGSDWRKWMLGDADLSPTGRGIPNVAKRVANLDRFVKWRQPTKIDFESVFGADQWDRYWSFYDDVIGELRKSQEFADDLRAKIVKRLARKR